MVDTRDLKSLAPWGVRVQVPHPVPLYLENQMTENKTTEQSDGSSNTMLWVAGGIGLWVMLWLFGTAFGPASLQECYDRCDADYINTARKTGLQNGDSLYTCKQRCKKQFE